VLDLVFHSFRGLLRGSCERSRLGQAAVAEGLVVSMAIGYAIEVCFMRVFVLELAPNFEFKIGAGLLQAY
jgi:hypothetical protein